ncbi:MAG: hypothetical protein FIB08_09555 [Candidatus Methanoperedens sp.]|nr:hypothetical protein [Candidatus Methanoperedens sp.]
MDKASFESTHEFFDLWLKTYEATYGRVIEIPPMGPSREKTEKVIRGFSTSVSLYAKWMESLINFQNVFIEAMRRMRENMASRIEGEPSARSYEDFYEVWIETYSETFKEFLKSGHFASDMGTFMSQLMDFQKNNREVLEENYLKPSGLPTRTEIDEINKEVYLLKKTVRELKSRMKELSGGR